MAATQRRAGTRSVGRGQLWLPDPQLVGSHPATMPGSGLQTGPRRACGRLQPSEG